jgi:hypothetical protein
MDYVCRKMEFVATPLVFDNSYCLGTLLVSFKFRLVRFLCAGAVAIALNEAVLLAADLIGLQTAHGGLLKLLVQLTGLIVPHSDAFNIAFHIAVGLAMAVLYGLVLAPRWRGKPWALGLLYAVAVWVMNAFLVLPAIGEGAAGSASLGMAGIAWFAVAHTVFFVSLAQLYAWMAAAPGTTLPLYKLSHR